jgi:hypothetical protein
MCVVDVWLVYSKCTETEEKQREFYKLLTEEIMDNQHGQVHRHQSLELASSLVGSPKLITAKGHMWSGISAHNIPTKRKRKTKEGANTRYMQQGHCQVCGMKTTQVCSEECQDANKDNIVVPEPWICKPTTFRTCFANHMAKKHDL